MSNTQITEETVMKIALLSKLGLDSTEISIFTPQLNLIFNYINQLSQVETSDVPPTAQINDQETVLRPDTLDSKRSLTAAEATSTAPTVDNYFVVDAVIDNS